MTKELQLRSVLDKAVRAYLVAKKRTRMFKNKNGGGRVYLDRKAAKVLAQEYPEFYVMRGPHKYLDFVGMSADDILEDYVHSMGEKRGGRLWRRLAYVVIARGEEDGE
jgi:hypothetical protein|tara:strand:+ start:377 stop:700 length:324 start_codon:yes stop_codon:yes gene_type:complete